MANARSSQRGLVVSDAHHPVVAEQRARTNSELTNARHQLVKDPLLLAREAHYRLVPQCRTKAIELLDGTHDVLARQMTTIIVLPVRGWTFTSATLLICRKQ